MKFHFNVLGLILALSLVSFSCATATQNAAPYIYTGDKGIYPAIHYAVVNGSPSYWNSSSASLSNPNTVIINNVQVQDGFGISDFTLRISLENNVVTYRFSNFRARSFTDTNWTRTSRFTQSNRESIFTNYFNTEIPKVMENESLYASAKEAADKSLGVSPRAVVASSGAQSVGAMSFSFALQNPHNYLLYPAVSAALTDLQSNIGSKTAYLREIDCLGNQFSIQNCVARRSANDFISYHINISYQNNQLKIDFANIGAIGSNIMQYSDAEIMALPALNTQRIADQFKTQIERSLASAAAYNTAKQAFLANNDFLNRAFIPVTNAMVNEFTQTLFKGGEIGLNMTILDVTKNDNAEFRSYSTRISAGLYTTVRTSGAFALIDLYTNDSSLARLRQSQQIVISGNVVRVDRTAMNYRFIMTK